MASHAVVAALSGFIWLAAFVLAVGDPTRALAVWLLGGAAGGVASVLAHSSPRLRQLLSRRRGA